MCPTYPGEGLLPPQNEGPRNILRAFLTCHKLSYCGAHLSSSDNDLSQFLEFALEQAGEIDFLAETNVQKGSET